MEPEALLYCKSVAFCFVLTFSWFVCAWCVRKKEMTNIGGDRTNDRLTDSLDSAFSPSVQPREPVADHAACAVKKQGKGRRRTGNAARRQEARNRARERKKTTRVTHPTFKRLHSTYPGHKLAPSYTRGGGRSAGTWHVDTANNQAYSPHPLAPNTKKKQLNAV